MSTGVQSLYLPCVFTENSFLSQQSFCIESTTDLKGWMLNQKLYNKVAFLSLEHVNCSVKEVALFKNAIQLNKSRLFQIKWSLTY